VDICVVADRTYESTGMSNRETEHTVYTELAI